MNIKDVFYSIPIIIFAGLIFIIFYLIVSLMPWWFLPALLCWGAMLYWVTCALEYFNI